MPELPEVETVRKDLHAALRGKTIACVDVRLPKIIRGSTRSFVRGLQGATVTSVERRGKLLLFRLDSGRTVLAHLKMTGQFFYWRNRGVVAGGHGHNIPEAIAEGRPDSHTHVVISMTNGDRLLFNDMRQFGFLELADEATVTRVLATYGPEPLDALFTVEYLIDLLRGRSASLKAVLLNQTLIAGLGNIYIDEASYGAKVRPQRRAQTITRLEAQRLHKSIQRVIARAIVARGTTFNSYRDASGRTGSYLRLLKVYKREGKPCGRASCRQQAGVIKKTTAAGRGTHYCPTCQT